MVRIKSRKLLDLVFGQKHKVSFTVVEFNCHLCAGYKLTSTTNNSVKICSVNFSNITAPYSIVFQNVCFCFVSFNFFSISQEIGWEEHLRNDLFCVEWDCG